MTGTRRTARAKRRHPFRQNVRAATMKKLAEKLKKDLKVEADNFRKTAEPIAYLSTGYQAMDDALTGTRDDNFDTMPGTGKGMPRGRIIEIFGPEAVAKTTLALAMIKQGQENGEAVAFIDAEHALDDHYAYNIMGINPKTWLYKAPDSGEEALDLLQWCVRERFSVVVLDSVSALVSLDELKGKRALGVQARMMSQTCRELSSYLKPGGPMVIFINQIRYKIMTYGNPEMTSGGQALKYYSSMRVELRKKKELKKTSKKRKGEPLVVGDRLRLRVVKNKVAPRDGRCIFDVMMNSGIRIPRLRSNKQTTDDTGEE